MSKLSLPEVHNLQIEILTHVRYIVTEGVALSVFNLPPLTSLQASEKFLPVLGPAP